MSEASPGPAEGPDRSVCSPCRGTGKVISSLDEAPHLVTCPWCDGSGAFQAGLDAQVTEPAEERK